MFRINGFEVLCVVSLLIALSSLMLSRALGFRAKTAWGVVIRYCVRHCVKFFSPVFGKARDLRFVTVLIVSLGCGQVVALSGCNATQVENDVQKVITLLPEVAPIIASILNIIAAAKGQAAPSPALVAQIQADLANVQTGFATAQTIVKTYQANMAGMPPTVLNELDAAVASVSTNLSSIEAVFPNLSSTVTAGINSGILSFQLILALLATIIPAPVAAVALPKTSAAFASRSLKFGVGATNIPTRREFAKDYNCRVTPAAKILKAKHYAIHVPIFANAL